MNEKIKKMSLNAAESQQKHQVYTEQLIKKITKLEKDVVGDAQSTINSVVDWKVSHCCTKMGKNVNLLDRIGVLKLSG